MKRNYIILGIGIVLLILGLFLDHQIANFFILNQNHFIASIFNVITFLGTGYVVVTFLTILFIIRNKNNLITLWLTFALTLLIVYLLKILILRERPVGDELRSFPSGHTTSVFTALPFLFREKISYGYIWLVFAFLILFTRIYLNQHFLTDVASSLLIGYTISELILYFKSKKIALYKKDKK